MTSMARLWDVGKSEPIKAGFQISRAGKVPQCCTQAEPKGYGKASYVISHDPAERMHVYAGSVIFSVACRAIFDPLYIHTHIYSHIYIYQLVPGTRRGGSFKNRTLL